MDRVDLRGKTGRRRRRIYSYSMGKSKNREKWTKIL
jgi:hypothetical protein